MADVGHELTNKELKKLERTLAKEYETAYKELKAKFDKQLKRFDVLDKQKLALLDKGKISQKEYDKWRNNQMLRSKWMNDMVKTSANDLVNVNKRASDIINNALPKIYAENYNFGTCMAEKLAKVDTRYVLYNKDAVAKLARSESIRLPKAKIDVPKDRRWNEQKMKSALTQGVLQGESNKQIAKRLASVTDMDRSSAIRNARTLTTGAENGGRLDSFFRAKENGIELMKMWSATMDDRTRDSHAFLDGVCVELEEEFPNGCMYPGDVGGPPEEVWNCRCALGSQLKGFERDVNHIVNGQQVTQDEYDEWKSAHGRFENIDGKWQKVKEQPVPTHKIVDGKDISATWTRRSDKYAFEIEDVINAQGFDGLPRVVSAEEFDKAVADSKFIAQRTYSAESQAILDEYRSQLYNGKWYVDCGTGGSQYGQGMYCAADYTGKITDGIRSEMKHYQMLGTDRIGEIAQDDLAKIAKAQKNKANEILSQYKAGKISKERGVELYKEVNSMSANEFMATYMKDSSIAGARSYTETITLHPSAKVISYDDLYRMQANESKIARGEIRDRLGHELISKAGLDEDERNYVLWGLNISKDVEPFDLSKADKFKKSISTEEKQRYSGIRDRINKAIDDEIKSKGIDKRANMDLGSYGVLKGYDAINAEGHGASGSYTVILNRTKCIIKGGV